MSKKASGNLATCGDISAELAENIRLFNHFVSGSKWINERKALGLDVADDIRSFNKNVVSALDKAYLSMTNHDREFFDKCRKTAQMFDGTIEIDAYQKLNKASRRAHGTNSRSNTRI